MTRWFVAGAAMLSMVSCAQQSRTASHAGADAHTGAAGHASGMPAVSSISPTSGQAGTAYPIELTISGHNFTDSTNTVTFGPVTIKAVKSTNGGTRIVIFAPKEMPSTGEVPPMPLMAGTYDVRVATAAGLSNVVRFRLTP